MRKRPCKRNRDNYLVIVLIRLTCSSQGGYPWPRLSFAINGTRMEAERLEPLVFGHEAVLSLVVTRDHANIEMACLAENELSNLPVSSNHQILGVKCMLEYETKWSHPSNYKKLYGVWVSVSVHS